MFAACCVKPYKYAYMAVASSAITLTTQTTSNHNMKLRAWHPSLQAIEMHSNLDYSWEEHVLKHLLVP